MELTVEDNKKVEDGVHTGTIIRIESRETPYKYTDLIIKVNEEKEVELKVGFATYLSQTSALGKLLDKFGVKLEVGAKIDPETILLNKEIQFQTTTNEKGYTEVMKQTIKPTKLDVGLKAN